jgi:hypothetical protein
MSLVLLQANARIDAPKRASDWRASPCRLHVAVPQNPQPALVGTTGAKSVRRCAQTDLETQITASVSWRLPSRQLLRVQSTSGHDASRPIDLRRGRPHRVPLSRSRDAAGSSPQPSIQLPSSSHEMRMSNHFVAARHRETGGVRGFWCRGGPRRLHPPRRREQGSRSCSPIVSPWREDLEASAPGPEITIDLQSTVAQASM